MRTERRTRLSTEFPSSLEPTAFVRQISVFRRTSRRVLRHQREIEQKRRIFEATNEPRRFSDGNDGRYPKTNPSFRSPSRSDRKTKTRAQPKQLSASHIKPSPKFDRHLRTARLPYHRDASMDLWRVLCGGMRAMLCALLRSAGPVPRHLAFIMDGNRRYAKRTGLPRYHGHEHGSQKVTSLPLSALTPSSVHSFPKSCDGVSNWAYRMLLSTLSVWRISNGRVMKWMSSCSSPRKNINVLRHDSLSSVIGRCLVIRRLAW